MKAEIPDRGFARDYQEVGRDCSTSPMPQELPVVDRLIPGELVSSIRRAGISNYFLLYDLWSFSRSCSHIFA